MVKNNVVPKADLKIFWGCFCYKKHPVDFDNNSYFKHMCECMCVALLHTFSSRTNATEARRNRERAVLIGVWGNQYELRTLLSGLLLSPPTETLTL